MAKIDVKTVALFFIALAQDAGEQLTHMKLQKMVYYAQAWYVGTFGEPLFDSEIEAWQFGPVCSEIYHDYKQYGKSDILFTDVCDTRKGCVAAVAQKIPSDVTAFLQSIADDYMQHSAFELSKMTHTEKPWVDAFSHSGVITVDSMRQYYGALVIDDEELAEIESNQRDIQQGKCVEWKPGMFS